MHLFVDCPFAQQVWLCSHLQLRAHNIVVSPFPVWLSEALRLGQVFSPGVDLLPSLAAVLWSIWLASNDLVFNSSSLSPIEVSRLSASFIRDWSQNLQMSISGLVD